MEYWDAYLEDGTRTEHILIRGEPIEEGLFHLVAKVMLIYNDEEILFMQRHPDKQSNPGCYEATAGGSVLRGESSEEGAIRELYEETGISVAEVERVRSVVDRRTHSIYEEYIAHLKDEKKPKVRLQDSETVNFQWVKISELLDFMETHEIVPRHREKILEYLDGRETVR